MPKMEVIPEKIQENPEKEITVQLDENNQPIKQEEKKEEPKYVTADILNQSLTEAIKKATAPLYYEMRKGRESQPVQPPVVKKEEPVDEWDKKLQTNWRGTVEELAEAKFNKMMEVQAQKQAAEYQRQPKK